MAMKIPQVGLQTMMKDGSKHFSGLQEASIRNITACKELAQVTTTSFGPNGMNKMVINHLEKLFVTSDAATIVRELEIQHPAAKMVVLASQMQEQEMGDGSNFVIILGGELLAKAEALLIMGLHPSEIVAGYEKASLKALEWVDEKMACGQLTDPRNKALVCEGIRTAIAAKQYGFEDFLAPLVTEACMNALPAKNPKNFNVDNIRVAKILGSGVLQSSLVKGMVFGRDSESTSITRVTKAKVAIFTCGVDIARTETKGTVLLKTADELKNFSTGEEELLEKQVKEIAEGGARVVVTGGGIGDLCLHFLEKYKLMPVKILSKFDLRRLAKSVGATPLTRFGAPTAEEMGYCDLVEVTDIGGSRVTVFRQDDEMSASAGGAISTLVVRGSTLNMMDDIERSIDDGVNCFKAMTKDPRYVPGAGATEIELAKMLTSFADTCPGLDQYAIKKFAEAFEAIPRALCETSGLKATEVISKLYAEHQAGRSNVGVNIECDRSDPSSSTTLDACEAKIFDLLSVKAWGIKMATNAAATVLRVDQIIMSKPAGGPKPPKQSQGMDMDDD
eukprot:Nk52_evm58s2391 gene=Nk52_evmTU58s2391